MLCLLQVDERAWPKRLRGLLFRCGCLFTREVRALGLTDGRSHCPTAARVVMNDKGSNQVSRHGRFGYESLCVILD